MDPTTRSSTPPASGRIAQQSPTSAVIPGAYIDTDFPAIAFTNQLAIDLTGKTLAYYDVNGAWQQILGGADVQSYYGPVPPTLGVRSGDRWWNTTDLNWNTWDDVLGDWMPGSAAYATVAPDNPDVGQPWFNTATRVLRYWDGTAWVLGDDPNAPGIYTGGLPDSATEGSSWTDDDGIDYACIAGYASGAGSHAKWQRVAYRVDPLAKLITGAAIIAREATATPATPRTTITITTGMIWLDLTARNGNIGTFFIYNGTAWKQVHAPNTIDLCLAIIASRNYREWQWEDRATVVAPGDQVAFLTYLPVPKSLFVRWHPDGKGGLPVTNEKFTLTGHKVAIPDAGMFKAGDQFSFQYEFNPIEAAGAVTFAPIGYTHEFVTNPIVLPAGTAIGDTIVMVVMNQRGWVATVTDPRLTLVASSPAVLQAGGNVSTDVYMGIATSLGNIAVTAPATWPIAAVVTFGGYMSHGITAQTVGGPGDIALPALNVGSGLLVLTQNNGTVTGASPSTLVPGYVSEAAYPSNGNSVWHIYAYNGAAPLPSGTTHQGSSGGDGQLWALAVEVTA